MGDDSIRVTATTVRVPVFNSHSESVNIETKKHANCEQIRSALKDAPGVQVLDDPGVSLYPHAWSATGQDDVFVGRVRLDNSHPCGLAMWVVSDNLRKGAALNAVQIAEQLVQMELV